MNKYIQRAFREAMKFSVIRYTLIKAYNTFKKNPVLKINNETIFSSLNVNKTIKELDKYALSETFLIDKSTLNAIVEDCKNQLVFPHLKFDGSIIKDGQGQKMDFDNPKPFQKDCIWFKYKDIQEWKSVNNIIYDPKILDIAKNYLGNNPIIRNQYLWWSFPAKANDNEDYDSPRYWFHYDIDDFKFLKIFIYLKDVDLQTGPHVVVKSTHKSKPWKYKFNRIINNSDLKGFFDDKEVVKLTGEKGTCFLEDTFTYHNGTPPQKPRLVLQIEYALTNLKLG
ncbi:hypothetical protein AX016_0783 [Cellulophaga sp. RHA19]|uniref:hypothetical protein n=1 Tax=Cellulophaga sp. RHA19 TaxID=1798237 RepID=UPI000C2C37A6|nr:hypothetical protein [Cellulophaga sp. RHA19]PKB42615.1 hypothetical protein AX016_0783 [Cellulophaga sp. RHA19]